MNDTLSQLADSIGNAHAAVNDALELVVREDGGPTNWTIQLSTVRPQVDTDAPHLVCELDDESAAHYAYKELVRRGFSDAGFWDETEEWNEDVRFLLVSKRER